MARKARNTYPVKVDICKEASTSPYMAALYARKSKADEESMEAQVHILENYVRTKTNYQIYQIYTDNGYSGVDFQRPAFMQMIEDMKNQKFQIILVKDSSRIGRNYLEVGIYIEEMFPKYHIQVIAINEQYEKNQMTSYLQPFINIMNEQYSKDLSRKLSSAFRMRQVSGNYIGSFAPYGYYKDSKNRGKLLIDEEVAPIVQELFRRKNKGEKNVAIVESFNKRGIPSPMAYRYEKGYVHISRYKDILWKCSTIDTIYQNPVYYGHMIQSRTRQSLAEGERRHRTKKGEWVVVKGTHPALVNHEENSPISTSVARGSTDNRERK